MHRLPTKLGVPKASAWLASVWTHAPSSDETRSAEGLGVAGCHDSVGGPLPAGWGPGQSPAGAQRRTKATHDPALYRDVHSVRTKATHDPATHRDVHPVQSPAGAQRRTKATYNPARYRDVHSPRKTARP